MKSTKNDFLIKNSFTYNEKHYLLSLLEFYGYRNIYLHHAIFSNSEKFVFILPYNFEIEEPLFISAYNRSNGELHLFTKKNEGISSFNYILYSTNNLTSIGRGIQYLGTDLNTSKMLFNCNPNLISKLIELNEYYVFTLKNEKFFKNLSDLKSRLNNDEKIKSYIASSKKDLLKLLNLQKGYLYEEMQYPEQILSEKFLFLNLQKILKYYKLFYLEYDNKVVAKCEWNAFTNKIIQIGGVYVDPDFRNHGFAFTLLFNMLIFSFENLKLDEASLFVRMSNQKAQKLYEKLLFERYKDNLIWAIFKTN